MDQSSDLPGLLDFADVLARFIKQSGTGELKTSGRYPSQLGEYQLKVSFGQGNVAQVPWIAILGQGQKVSLGIYPVFLYYKSSDHLILAYGVSETERPLMGWGAAVDGRPQVSQHMQSLGLQARRYGDSFVAAHYPDASKVVDTSDFNAQVITDLSWVMRRYGQVLAGQPALSSPVKPSAEPIPVAPSEVAQTMPALNQILFGPPGTGKTYATIEAALEVLDPQFLVQHHGDRTRLKARFDELSQVGLVRFVTFHQSFSYEDFVEGIRAISNEERQIEYPVESGVFKRLCDDARTYGEHSTVGIGSNPRIWKISIDGTGSSPTQKYCLANGEARIGWGRVGDLSTGIETNPRYDALGSSDKGTLRYFAEGIQAGDILLCIRTAETVGAVGVVTGDYRFEPSPPQGVIGDYMHVRPVKWLYKDLNLPIMPINDGRRFVQKTVYDMGRLTWGDVLSYLNRSGAKPIAEQVSVERRPHVLIIDEINRGNVSRIFGELITLIEPSKREGADEALSVELPYSKKPFSVPENVYLIGTMNTADRSLAGLDIALRRRFVFREMLPDPTRLEGVSVEGVSIPELLSAMNQRIEVLLGRDHCLGHAYFMPLKNDPSLDRLEVIFRNQVLPLLQEYFFEDWERIQWVLNDHRKTEQNRFVAQQRVSVQDLFGTGVNVPEHNMPWVVNGGAFERLEAYMGIIDHQLTVALQRVERELAYGDFVIRQLSTGSIEVEQAGVPQSNSIAALRGVATSLGISLLSGTGARFNTRTLGRKVLDALEAQKE